MKLLLTLDGSTFAETAIPVTQRLARAPGTEIHLMAVAEPPPPAPADRHHRVNGVAWLSQDGAGDPPDALPVDVELELEHYLETIARLFPAAVVKPVLRVGPHPAEQIAAYAEANEIDLIVMATHGRSGINQLVHGSVAGRVLRTGVAPVALIRPTTAA